VTDASSPGIEGAAAAPADGPDAPSTAAGSDAPSPAVDPASLLRSRQYRVLLVLAAIVGVVVSAASWGFLEAVHQIQVGVYRDLPGDVGYSSEPAWWPLPWLALAGALTAVAIVRLPGRGGHVPADGLAVGGKPTQPIDLPGVLLAALATLGLGLVLGPEAPLIALGLGLGALSMRLVRRDAPDQAVGLMAAAGSFAAISTIFGSPVIGAVVIIEAAGLGGAMLPLVLLPGLLAAGIGSLVFIGMGSWTGLSNTAWALSAFPLPHFGVPSWSDFGWTIALALATAIIAFAIVMLARLSKRLVEKRIFVLTIVAGLVVGGLAIAFAQSTGQPPDSVLFSGQDDFNQLFGASATIALSTLALLLVFKGLAWSVSLGNFRGGPTFPAIFLGVVGGLLAGHLPGFSESPAVAVLVGATCVSILRLPLSSVVIALLLSTKAGLGIGPLIIVGVVVAYLASEALTAYAGERAKSRSAPADAAAPAGSA
jgi:H+/Cl- antiporter ClcA